MKPDPKSYLRDREPSPDTFKKGITIEQISEKLGHRSSIVTKRYIGINQDEINRIEDEVCL